MSVMHVDLDISYTRTRHVRHVIDLVGLVLVRDLQHVLLVGMTPLLVVELMVMEKALMISQQPVPVYVIQA